MRVSTAGWMEQAACADITDRRIFFEETRSSVVRVAKKVCLGCAVRAECLAYAIEHREIGVWGGTTTNERAKQVRAQRREMAHSAQTM